MSDVTMIHALMIGLVERAGGPENAARMIDARMGRPLDKASQSTRKGTVSKRLSGQLSWPLDEILALEDVTGNFAVRDWLRLSRGGQEDEASSMMQLLSEATLESGQGLSAAMSAVAGGGCPSHARKELAEAISAMKRLKLKLGDAPDA